MAKKREQLLSRKQRFLLRQAPKDRAERVRMLVEKYLEPHRPAACRLVTHRGSVMEHNGCWYVVVDPDSPKDNGDAYCGRLMNAEEDLERYEGLLVMLTLMLPQDYELEYEMPVFWALRELK